MISVRLPQFGEYSVGYRSFFLCTVQGVLASAGPGLDPSFSFEFQHHPVTQTFAGPQQLLLLFSLQVRNESPERAAFARPVRQRARSMAQDPGRIAQVRIIIRRVQLQGVFSTLGMSVS
ncbi:Neural Cell Adhesion Molecule 1 [Manis pentadactyla]|nr:Neural Cell Adhesion Molecule 1 [Manis pentadactyla]